VVIPGLLLVLVWKGYNAVFEANVNPELAPYELYVEPGTTLETWALASIEFAKMHNLIKGQGGGIGYTKASSCLVHVRPRACYPWIWTK